MKKLVLSVLLLISAVVSAAMAQSSDSKPLPLGKPSVPSIIQDGFSAYEKDGSKAALAAWLKGSPVAGNTGKVEDLFGAVEAMYGKMLGFDVISSVNVGPFYKRVYVVLNYEKGPLFVSFDCYKTKEAWIVPSLDCNTKIKEVFPPALFDGTQH